jgi:hypothetical protein
MGHVRKRNWFRPNLEQLEKREVLKTTTWTGAFGNGWLNGANWNNGIPVSGDTVILAGSNNPTIPAMDGEVAYVAYMATLELDTGFSGQILQLDADAHLVVENTTGVLHEAGSIRMGGTSNVTVYGNYNLQEGNIESSAGVVDSGILTIDGGVFTKNGAAASVVTCTVAVYDGGFDVIGGDISLDDYGHIYIHGDSALTLSSDRNSGDGNIFTNDDTTVIDVHGIFERTITQGGATESPYVSVEPILITHPGATLMIGDQAYVRLGTHTMNVAADTYETTVTIGASARFGRSGQDIHFDDDSTILLKGQLDGNILVEGGSSLQVGSTGSPTVSGNLDVVGGSDIWFGSTTCFLSVTGDMNLASMTLYISSVGNNQTNNTGNKIVVTGNVSVSSCTLDATFSGTFLSGSKSQFITAGSTTNGTGTTPAVTGFTPTWHGATPSSQHSSSTNKEWYLLF